MKGRFLLFHEYFMVLDLDVNDRYKDLSVSSSPELVLDSRIKILPADVDEVVG